MTLPLQGRRRLAGSSSFHEHAEAFDDGRMCAYTLEYQERMADTTDALPHEQEIPAWGSPVVRRAILRLPGDDAKLLRLYYVEHKTHYQISLLMKCSRVNVTRRLKTATRRLYLVANHKSLKYCKVTRIRGL